MASIKGFFIFVILIGLVLATALKSETNGQSSEHGKKYSQLVIRNVTIIDGNGTPPEGPMDVIVKDNTIQSVQYSQKDYPFKEAERVIDGTGMYLLPGLINLHAHIHEERGGKPIPFEYLYKLWLSCGITTVRDMGSNTALTLLEREKSLDGSIVAPRIFLYMVAWTRNPGEARKRVQEIKRSGGDGVKIFGNDRDVFDLGVDRERECPRHLTHPG